MTATPRQDWKPIFLASLAEVPVVARAARAVGLDRSTVYRHRDADADFAKAWDDAIEDGIDNAEQEAFRRGVVGWREPLTHQGRLTYEIEHYVPATGLVCNDDGEAATLAGETVRWRYKLDAAGQRIPLTITKHSDALLALVLKGRRKKVFSDRTEITGADGSDLKVVDETARSARVAQLLALAQGRKEGADIA